LRQSGCYTAANIRDADYFREVVQSMNEIGFNKDEQNKIWVLLLAILDLGNLEFDDTNHKDNESVPCKIINN
jgi:myosin-5